VAKAAFLLPPKCTQCCQNEGYAMKTFLTRDVAEICEEEPGDMR